MRSERDEIARQLKIAFVEHSMHHPVARLDVEDLFPIMADAVLAMRGPAATPARDAAIEECAKHIEREADVATNSLHCGDNSQTIAATHRVSRAYHEAAKSIRSLVSRPNQRPEES